MNRTRRLVIGAAVRDAFATGLRTTVGPAPLGPDVGAELLEKLGFLLVPGAPFAEGRAYLFVCLRRRPTLRHFDPERVDYWVVEERRGVRATFDWFASLPTESAFAWGSLRVIDRLGMSNEYVSFGGTLRVGKHDGRKVAVFGSSAPILARGGHSQGWDPGAEEAAAFLARLRAAAGRSLEFEHRLSELAPEVIYAAFVADSRARYRDSLTLADWRPRTLSSLRREEVRLRDRAPADWTSGAELAEAL